MNKKLLFGWLLVLPLIVSGQNNNDQADFGIKFSGFVKNDFFFDTRQTVDIREGHFLLYPAEISLDKNGQDVNAVPSFNILSIQTRLTGKISGPDAFGAKTSGMIEGAFFGHSNADINGFRLRHAYLKLNWEKTELLLGQTWHAMFITDCFPDVISFNTGVPFQPFSRNPQIRLTKTFGNLDLVITAMSQRDFTSSGGSGTLRNSMIPNFNMKLQYKKENKEKGSMLVAGVGGDAKSLKPRLISTAGYKTDQKVEGLSGIAYLKVKTSDLTVKFEGVYGQNLYDLTMLGGYAYAYTDDTNVIKQDQYEYTTLNNISFWTDIHSNGSGFQAGLFAGYTKNMGSMHNILDWTKGPFFARGANIDYIYRISPRIIFNSGKTRLAAEFEYTVAAYGDLLNNDSLGKVTQAEEVVNLRILLGAYYFF